MTDQPEAKRVISLAIVGSRDWPWTERMTVYDYVSRLPPDVAIRSGGASGPDSWAAEVARHRGMPLMEILVDPTGLKDIEEEQGKQARYREFTRRAYERNGVIVSGATAVMAFWVPPRKGERPGGTWNSIEWAVKLDKPLQVVMPRGYDAKTVQLPKPRMFGVDVDRWWKRNVLREALADMPEARRIILPGE